MCAAFTGKAHRLNCVRAEGVSRINNSVLFCSICVFYILRYNGSARANDRGGGGGGC